MDKEQLYEQLEAYLAGTLPAAERDLLEKQIAADSKLAAEVDLHRRLHTALSNAPKIAFRQQLDTIAKEFPPSPPGFRLWWFAPPLLLIALLIIWRISVPKPGPLPEPDLPKQQIVRDSPVLQQPPQIVPQKTTQPRQAFAPNPELEQMLNMAPDVYFTAKDCRLEAAPTDTLGLLSIVFFGKMFSALDVPALHIALLDNSVPAGKLRATIPVKVTPLEDDTVIAFSAKKSYRLQAVQTLRLKPGLYYGQLKRNGETKVLWTGKFKVK